MPEMGFDFRNKHVMVTGASEGIGAVTARLFAEHGADVTIVARRTDKLDQAAERIRSTGRRCLATPADVTDPLQVQTMVERCLREFGRIDILVNNAGGSVRSTLRKLTPEIWQRGRAPSSSVSGYAAEKVEARLLGQEILQIVTELRCINKADFD
jgi:NAD(P)-dependent dehydrogenase (short-subunit alcohol dehydrogenase family)